MKVVEKIAKGIAKASFEKQGLAYRDGTIDDWADLAWPDYEFEARAALTVLLEPSEGMVDAAYEVMDFDDRSLDEEGESFNRRVASRMMTASVQAALDEG